MVGLEFADPVSLRPRPDLAKRLLGGALERHLLLLSCGIYGHVVRFIPPLMTTDDEVDSAVDTVARTLAELSH